VLIAGVLGRGAWTLSGSFTGGGSATWQGALPAAASGSAASAAAAPMALPPIQRKAAPHVRTGAGRAVVPVN
jgi:hypothetical protein